MNKQEKDIKDGKCPTCKQHLPIELLEKCPYCAHDKHNFN